MIGVILNPNAAGARDPGLPARLRAIVGRDGEVFETRRPDELAPAIDEIARRGCELIATCGGDGTHQVTISAVLRRFPPAAVPRFIFLRGGTINTIAKNLGIFGSPEEILARVLDRWRRKEPQIEVGQDLLSVDDEHGFLLAAGMGARFLERYYAGPTPGFAWAGALALRTISSAALQGAFARALFDAAPCTLVADGETLPLDTVRFLVASVVPDVGIGMRVAWQAGRQPNRFHLVASALRPSELVRQLDRVLRGEPLRGTPHIDRLVHRLDLEFAAPQSYTLDGEMFRARRLRVTVGSRLWILKP